MSWVKSRKVKKVAIVVLMVCGVMLIAIAAYPGWHDLGLVRRWTYAVLGAAWIFVAVDQALALKKLEGTPEHHG
jgi:hypothetical protein